jgi:hypothetical protein
MKLGIYRQASEDLSLLASELLVSKGRNRRSDRYPLVVPVKVKWSEPSGAGVIEFAEAKGMHNQHYFLQVSLTIVKFVTVR